MKIKNKFEFGVLKRLMKALHAAIDCLMTSTRAHPTTWSSDINVRAFNAILAGTKTVEVRTNTPSDPLDYSKFQPGDILILDTWPEPSTKRLRVTIKRVTHYASAHELLRNEGVERSCSIPKASLEEAELNMHRFTGYKESIPIYGIYAIEVSKPELVSAT